MTGVLAFEWTKLRTVRSTWWCLLTGLLLAAAFTPATGAGLAAVLRAEDDPSLVPVVQPALVAVNLVQLALTTVAVLAVTSEYATRSIEGTLQAVPARGRLLVAKAAVVLPVAALAGAVFVLLGTALARPALGDRAEFEAGAAALDVVQLTAYLTLAAAIALGLGFVLRSTAGALTATFVLLGALPAILFAVHTPVLDAIGDWLPTTAGAALVTGEGEPYSAGVAFAVLLAWAAAALCAGALTLRRRDA